MKKSIKKISKKVAPGLARKYGQIDTIESQLSQIQSRINESLNDDLGLNALKNALREVEFYQPLYGLEGIQGNAKRDNSRVRCETILNALRGDVNNLNILDIGSSLGYIPFFFADRGSDTVGWEADEKNANVSRLVKSINGIKNVDFLTKQFNSDTIDTIDAGQYDVVCLLSVLHHITYKFGLNETKDLLSQLLDKIPVMFVELAVREEFSDKKGVKNNDPESIEKMKRWQSTLPEDPLDIFKGIKDIDIKHIDDFDTHLTSVKRPMYMVTKKVVYVGGKPYRYDFSRKVAYDRSKASGDRVYYFGANDFIKEYRFKKGDRENLTQIIGELNTYLALERADIKTKTLPKLKDFSVETNNIRIVLERLKGRIAFDMDYALKESEVLQLFTDVARALARLESVGIHHNDIRPWNIIIDDKNHGKLIDFGNTASTERENNIATFLWTAAYYLTSNWSVDFKPDSFPPQKLFDKSEALLTIYNEAKTSKNYSFHKIADRLKNTTPN